MRLPYPLCFALLLGAAGPAAAEGIHTFDPPKPPAPATAPLAGQPDDAYINLTGTVVEVRPDAFVLDIGSGEVTVAMGAWDWYRRDFRSLEGAQVSVQGRIDRRWNDQRVLAATSVLAPTRRTLFYAPGRDRYAATYQELIPIEQGSTRVHGTIVALDPEQHTVRIDAGGTRFDVLTDRLDFDPFAGQVIALEPGDRIAVAGDLITPPVDNRDATRRQSLDATALYLLDQDAQTTAGLDKD